MENGEKTLDPLFSISLWVISPPARMQLPVGTHSSPFLRGRERPVFSIVLPVAALHRMMRRTSLRYALPVPIDAAERRPSNSSELPVVTIRYLFTATYAMYPYLFPRSASNVSITIALVRSPIWEITTGYHAITSLIQRLKGTWLVKERLGTFVEAVGACNASVELL